MPATTSLTRWRSGLHGPRTTCRPSRPTNRRPTAIIGPECSRPSSTPSLWRCSHSGSFTRRCSGCVRPILSIAMALLIVYTAWDIVRESLNILLEGLPRGMRLTDVATAAKAIDGVLDVHDLHIWSLGSSTHALSCHVLIEDVPPSASDAILRRINGMLADRFSIGHTTVQFEHVSCAISESGCAIPVHDHHHHHDSL